MQTNPHLLAMENLRLQFKKMNTAMVQVSGTLNRVCDTMRRNSALTGKDATDMSKKVRDGLNTVALITESLQKSSENARITGTIAEQSGMEAERGGRAVNEAIHFMTSIAEHISIIKEIAAQTNLLALNAAIIAARAGSQGQEFVVVAGEVRNLAEKASKSAAEIMELADTGVKSAQNAGKLIKEIIPTIQQNSILFADFTDSTLHQISGLNQITGSLDSLTHSALEYINSAELMNQVSDELGSIAIRLTEITGTLK
jgi:methyl-accepting chemotaxis protein